MVVFILDMVDDTKDGLDEEEADNNNTEDCVRIVEQLYQVSIKSAL